MTKQFNSETELFAYTDELFAKGKSFSTQVIGANKFLVTSA